MITTASELKQAVESKSSYFSQSNMRMFGDSMSNYGVRLVNSGKTYELYRHKANDTGLTSSAYFDRETLVRVYL